MIVFNLICPEEHQFEGWFRSNEDFEAQREKGGVSCPVCSSCKVNKAIMAPNISTRRNHETSPAQTAVAGNEELTAKIYDMARQVRSHVEENFEYVGAAFPEEARKAYEQEDGERQIYGEATPKEVRELLEDGVTVAPLPDVPAKGVKKKLN